MDFDEASHMSFNNEFIDCHTEPAAKVFILMPKDVPISRASRLQWLIDNLNTVISVSSPENLNGSSSELEILSIVPEDGCRAPYGTEYLVTNLTKVVYVSQMYRFVYCLDMSPSQSAVDIVQGKILFDEVIHCFKTSLLGLCSQFEIPCSTLHLQPSIYLTVIVNTPFFISPAQQVIVKGVRVSSHNIQEIINLVQVQFHHLEGKIADVSAKAYDQIDLQMLENEDMYGGLFDLCENDCIANIPMVSPDANFVNMLRYSMLAIQLLPENSLSHIIVITDGVVAMPDSSILESLLYQLHYDSIAVSFQKVGSLFKPDKSVGYVPYTDLLNFLSHSTLGSVLDVFPAHKQESVSMNIYQEQYLLWSFHTNYQPSTGVIHDNLDGKNHFRTQVDRSPPLLSKRQAEEKVNSSLSLLISRRMREGYTLNMINFNNGLLKIKLTLHWKTYIFIHYELTSTWPAIKQYTHLDIIITAPYEFLHDITCIMKKETKSTFRQAVFERFWIRSTQLATNENILAQQLSSFENSNVWSSLPESVRSGMPVFVANTGDIVKVSFAPNDPMCTKFSQIWQPICYLDTSNWRKWFHTHRLSVILKHDQPLPKHMHLSNSSGRFQVVQCRQAASALYGMLCEWSSFVLVDNHTYVKLLNTSNNASGWFCVVRVTSKLPCATIILGFITGTPGQLRHQVCEELKRELTSLSYLSTALKSKEDIGCTLLLKPLEKILIRYERIPTDFHTVIFPDGTQNSSQTLPLSPFAGTLFTTLSRYLFHQRWIWSATHLSNERLDVGSLARILGTLTRMRVMEGFNFAHSASGIITMVKELRMNAPHSSCVIQYVLFPPHSAWWMERASSGGGSEEENELDTDSELQIVTEVWIEPQFGSVISNSPRVSYMADKRYYELAGVIKMMDKGCIHSLLTLEHLIYMCKVKDTFANGISGLPQPKARHFRCDSLTNQSADTGYSDTKYWNPTLVQRIQQVPFHFDPISILSQCQQTELLFSMFIEDVNRSGNNSNKILLSNIQKHILVYLNDCELELSSEESARFTGLVRAKASPKMQPNTQWRCYVKGVSEVHVILTIIPATIDDLKKSQDKSDPMHLPIYVYNCPLSFLVDSHVNCLDTNNVLNHDVFQDHRFKMKPPAEAKAEAESNNSDDVYNSVKQYCKAIVVAHSRCFAMSLYLALHCEAFVDKTDVDAAMSQCVKNSYEIDITHYLKTICSHIKDNKTDFETQCCNEMKPVHRLIKEKFLKIISDAFNVIPDNEEYYYCGNLVNYGSDVKIADSDDEDDPPSPLYEIHFGDEKDVHNSLDEEDYKCSSPLFLHFICLLKIKNQIIQMPVKILPTCLADLISSIEPSDIPKLSVSLDMGLLTLPSDNVHLNTKHNSRSDGSFSFDFKEHDHLQQVSDLQKRAVQKLQGEIKWLLQDEIATALLDVEPVAAETLHFVMKHVTESHNSRSSCLLAKIDLNFVYKTSESYDKFVQQFCCIHIPNYKLCQEGDLYYLVKNTADDDLQLLEDASIYKSNDNISDVSSVDVDDIILEFHDEIDDPLGDYNWLIELNNKRPYLPNFWLITQIEKDIVTVYFHCRFMQLPSKHVEAYTKVQEEILEGVRKLCKCVNQSLLLKSLYDTRICNDLLEPIDNYQDWGEMKSQNNFRSTSMEETLDELIQTPHIEASLKFKAGYFSCPVVWEIHFTLHQRLKTGPMKPGLSIGISALKTVLDKFSVTNRNNMFVYSDSTSDVFYLRLHENSMNSTHRGMHVKSNEFEQPVSRSPSITSLPIGPHRSNLARSDFSISSTTSSDARPRVQSFGEKDTTKESPSNEDIVTLKVYGITDAKDDIRIQLMQVLQNRLDDAVLELLSVMLSRNAMCPLTPEDVHFLQKPFKVPEHIIKLSIPHHSVKLLDSFIHYLKQNLLQFLNVPKYTDSRPKCHFMDYTASDRSNNRVTDENIFIYNQSQNPSSGSRGIACIALAIIDRQQAGGAQGESLSLDEATHDFAESTASTILTDEDELPLIYLEFRIWKQGRVNYDILHEKLCAATSHSTWDIIMEYHYLTFQLCVDKQTPREYTAVKVEAKVSNEIQVDLKLDTSLESGGQNVKRNVQKGYLSPQFSGEESDNKKCSNLYFKPLELGDNGRLTDVFQDKIHDWFEFAIDLKVPALKKITINLTHPNPLHSTLNEIQTIINMFPQENVKCFTLEDDVYVPYIYSLSTVSVIVISRNFDHWRMSTSSSESQPNILEMMRTQTNKHIQRFMHSSVGDKLIPRQKFLWAIISSRSIELFVYNWSKDNVIKLRTYCEYVNNWLNVRASTLNASCAQKIGLFHNQAIDHIRMSNNPYVNCIGDVEAMRRCPKEKSRKTLSLDCIFLESFRNNYKHLQMDCFDTVATFTLEMSEIRKANKKQRDDAKKLYSMYQTRTNSSTESQIQLMLQNSRILHYCHTPILFLSRWRLQSAATRDYSLTTVSRLSTASEEDEEWHDELYKSFATEYKRYLQTLGFMTLEIDSIIKPKIAKSLEDGSIVYMHKAIILGGILLFSINLKEPFFITKLYALECNRIHPSSRTPMNQYIQTFLDECDTIKSSMHLHSFTYDFHLRSIYNYISNNQGYRVRDGYHLIQFLDDFMKYYNKAPNYARNLVHADSMIIGNLLTEGKQLYTYLLSNVKQYNLSVVSMHNIGEGMEYVLIQVSNISDVTYRDAQDRQHTDDFDITLIISNISTMYNNSDNVIHLKYYLILTSGREIYPKTEVERKLGKFRTVSSTSRTATVESECLREIHEDCESDRKSESDRSELTNYQSTTDDESSGESKTKRQSHIEIKPESVNYLGYYSSHEQLMQQLILNCADNTKKTIKEMVTQGTVDCRTHLLWNKLLSHQDNSQLTFGEFVELKGLSKLESLGDIHPNLGSLINQPLHWYQGLAKLLLYKYHEQHRFYASEDDNIQYYVILHPRCIGAFMLLSIDMHTSRGDLHAVYRAPQNVESSDMKIPDRKNLLDGFINCICFYLWSGMI